MLKRLLSCILLLILSFPVMYAQNDFRILPIKSGSKTGAMNTNGQIIVPAEFDQIGGLSHNRYILTRNANLYGLYSASGQELLPTKYSKIESLDTLLIKFTDGQKYGLVCGNKKVYDLVLDDVMLLNSQLVAYKQSGKYGYANTEGQILMPAQADSIEHADSFLPNRSQIILAHRGKEKSLHDQNGKALAQALAEVHTMPNGYIFYGQAGNYKLMDFHGKTVINEPVKEFYFLSPVFMAVKNSSEKWALFALNSNRIVTPFEFLLFQALEDYASAGGWYVKAKKDKLLGLLDEQGQEILSYNYQNIHPIGHKLFSAQKEGKWGVLKAKDLVQAPFEYELIYNFAEDANFVKARKNNLEGLLSTQGKIALAPDYDLVELYPAVGYDAEAKSEYDHIALAYKGNAVSVIWFWQDKKLREENFNHFTELPFDPEDLSDRIEFKYSVIDRGNGLRWWQNNRKKWLLITPTKKTVITEQYDDIRIDPYVQLTLARKKDVNDRIIGSAVVDHINGKILFSSNVNSIEISDFRFSNVARIITDSLYDAVVSRDGKMLRTFGGSEADSIGEFIENKLLVRLKNRKVGFLDGQGQLVIPAVYDSAGTFQNGFSKVKMAGKYGYINAEGKLLVPAEYDALSPLVGGFAIAIKNGKSGLVSKEGTLSIPCVYDRLSLAHKGLVRARKGLKWGLLNTANQTVLDFSYTHIGDFKNGYAKIKQGPSCGLINEKGQITLPPQINADDFGEVQNGIFWVGLGKYIDPSDPLKRSQFKQIGYATLQGKIIIEPVYERISNFENVYAAKYGFAEVLKNGKLGYIDHTGKEVIPAVYESIEGDFLKNYQEKNAIFKVKKDGLLGYINGKGDVIIEPKYQRIEHFEEIYKSQNASGIAAAQDGSKHGAINFKGQVILPFEYDFSAMSPHNDTLLVVRKNGKWGMVSAKNKVIVPVEYDKLKYLYKDGKALIEIFKNQNKFLYFNNKGEFLTALVAQNAGMLGDGLIPAKLNDKWGFVDIKGQTVISPVYDSALQFVDGLAPVMQGGKWGFVDKNGKTSISLRFEAAQPFAKGAAIVKEKGLWGVINSQGSWLYPATCTSIGAFDQNGLAIAYSDVKGLQLCAPLSTEGKLLGKKFMYKSMLEFSEGLAPVQLSDPDATKQLWGFIDLQGNLKIPATYAQAQPFADGYARVKLSRTSKQWSYINKNAEIVIKARYQNSSDFGQGVAVGDGGLIFDPQAKIVGQIQDSKVRTSVGFVEGKIAAQAQDGFCHFKKDGKPLYKARYDSVTSFSNGIAFAKSGEIWELTRKVETATSKGKLDETKINFTKPKMMDYIAENGKDKLVVNKKYNEAFKDVSWRKINEGKWYMLDENGSLESPAEYEAMQGFGTNVIMVRAQGTYGYISPQGEVIVPAEYDVRKYLYDNSILKLESGGQVLYLDLSGKKIGK
ncbi:MAG: WG repeat-containing protein [Cytophagales bacterium]|nr:MAG: WG repeat-containing protein [Cytophagales bacterium]TAF59839.1 MAG: WG repeat-containing protein [Cytophagales bacterium]